MPKLDPEVSLDHTDQLDLDPQFVNAQDGPIDDLEVPEEEAAPAATEEPTGTAPEPTEEPTDTEPAAEPTPTEVSTEADAPKPSDTDEEPTPDDDMKKIISDMQKTIERQQNQINAMHRRMKNRPAIKKPDAVDDASAPKLDDFDTLEEYEKAIGKWNIDKQINDGIREAITPEEEVDLKERHEDLVAFAEGVKKDGHARYDDFAEVAEKDTLPITIDVIEAIRETESDTVKPEDIFYYLGKNPTEATMLSRMTPVQVALNVNRIAGAVAKAIEKAGGVKPAAETKTDQASEIKDKKKPKTVTDAPTPIQPTDSTVIITKDPEKMSQAEYEKWRNSAGSK